MIHTQKGELAFVRIILPLLLGITVGITLPCTKVNYTFCLVVSVVMLCALSFSIKNYIKYKLYLKRWQPGLLVQALVFFASISITFSQNPLLNENHFSKVKNEALVISIASEPKLSGDILRFEAKVKQGLFKNEFSPQSGLLLVALKIRSDNDYGYGDELLIENSYTKVDPPFNPYEFDFKSYLANRGIYHQLFIDQFRIKILKKHQGNYLITYALNLRKRLVFKFNNYIHDKEAASVASTLILGYKADLSREVLNAYSKTGTMHVLSVSGMHVGIVFAVLNWILGFLGRNQTTRLFRAILIIVLIWFYALITGFSPSVSRAALMLSIYILGKAINRSSNSYNLVAASAVFLLIYNPYFLLDVGFQLSYLAVLGLIYFYPKIYHSIYTSNWLADKVWSYVSLSCAAQLATFPLGMYYFHQFPVYFLISNLFIVLPVVLIMYLGIGFLFIPWDGMLKITGLILEKSIVWMDNGLFYIENFSFATISSYNSHILYYLLIYSIIATAILSIQYKSRKLFYTCLIFCLLFITYRSVITILSDGKAQIVFYSLRKHSAIGFFDGRKANLYTDLDSADKTMAFSVAPSLQAFADKVIYSGMNKQNSLPYFDGNFLLFKRWKMLLWNKEFNSNRYSGRIKVNALLLSGSPRVKLSDALKIADTKIVLIDGTNSDYFIRGWMNEASETGIKTYVLKKNPAYRINLD